MHTVNCSPYVLSLSEKTLARLPKDIQEYLGTTKNRIFLRDDFTAGFVIDCPSQRTAEVLLPFAHKIFALVSQQVGRSVEGAVIHCPCENQSEICSERGCACFCERFKAFV